MAQEAERTRREFLEDTLRRNPNDAFAHYGLAMEIVNGEPDAAWTHFEYLLTHQPEYAATYYQAGTFLARQGRVEEARKVLAAGVEVTSRQGNRHAQSELQSALDDLNNF